MTQFGCADVRTAQTLIYNVFEQQSVKVFHSKSRPAQADILTFLQKLFSEEKQALAEHLGCRLGPWWYMAERECPKST